jgi:hypothetical protein
MLGETYGNMLRCPPTHMRSMVERASLSACCYPLTNERGLCFEPPPSVLRATAIDKCTNSAAFPSSGGERSSVISRCRRSSTTRSARSDAIIQRGQ